MPVDKSEGMPVPESEWKTDLETLEAQNPEARKFVDTEMQQFGETLAHLLVHGDESKKLWIKQVVRNFTNGMFTRVSSENKYDPQMVVDGFAGLAALLIAEPIADEKVDAQHLIVELSKRYGINLAELESKKNQ